MQKPSSAVGYTLVVCEKPDVARKFSEALADGGAKSSVVEGVTTFRFQRGNEELVVCSVQGHVYGISDPFEERTVYPVFDLEWYASNLLDKENPGAARRIAAIRKLALGASRFVNACDFDAEGETIGFNVLRYACSGKESGASRARFSSLTKTELVRAFEEAKPEGRAGLARAGRARHYVDFVWGVNVSRVLSRPSPGRRFKNISMGRVQGPTLGFLVEREKEIRSFVSTPYWKILGIFERNGKVVPAEYSEGKIGTKRRAESVKNYCAGKEAIVTTAGRRTFEVGPPPPFNLGDLQREAFRVFGYLPKKTLQIAERLYLTAVISYPRTGSQRLPASIDYASILRGLEGIKEYSNHSQELLGRTLKPVQGPKQDQAHPAIHPTGERPHAPLDSSEAAIFDLIVRRFIAAFGQTARREVVDAILTVGDHRFIVDCAKTVYPGWIKYYGRYSWFRDSELPELKTGDRYKVASVKLEEKFEQRPSRFNQSSLLEKMEKEGIGTKATRADIIATLFTREYVSGGSMEVTDLGLSVADTVQKYAPTIAMTSLTREIEQQLEQVEEESQDEGQMLRATVRSIVEQMEGLEEHRKEVGKAIDGSVTSAEFVLGRCPICGTGRLRIVRSRKSRKRFVGCSNYGSGCRASAPLPQHGAIRTTTAACEHCSWPIVYLPRGRFQLRICVNVACPGKRGKKP